MPTFPHIRGCDISEMKIAMEFTQGGNERNEDSPNSTIRFDCMIQANSGGDHQIRSVGISTAKANNICSS